MCLLTRMPTSPCPIGRGHSPRPKSPGFRPDVPCPCPIGPTRTSGHPRITHRHSLSTQVSPIVGPAGDAMRHRTGQHHLAMGPSFPFAVPKIAQDCPESFRGVPSTRMRHKIGQQPVKDPLSANPVDSPPGLSVHRCPERLVPFSDRCLIASAPVRTSELLAQSGPQASNSKPRASRPRHTPLPTTDNGTRI